MAMKLTGGTEKLRQATRATDGLLTAITAYDNAWPRKRRQVLERVNEIITATARKFIRSNFAKSGIESKSGKLAEEINNVVAVMQLRDLGKPAIFIRFRKGIGEYDKKSGGGNFYQAAAAVEYGAVRGAKNAKRQEKRRLKKKAMKQKEKTGQAKLEDGVFIKKGRESKSKGQKVSFFGSTITATDPHPFFKLNGSQQQMLTAQALDFFIAGMIGQLNLQP